MTGKSRKIASNVVANYFGQGWSALMAIAFLPIYVATLGFESYGLIAFFAVLQSVLSVFDLGITASLTLETARQSNGGRTNQSLRDLIRSCEILGCVSNIFLALLVWGLADRLASKWIKPSQLEPESVVFAVILMGVVIAARLQEGVYRGVLIGLERQLNLNAANALMATIRYAGAVGVLHYGHADIVSFFVWQVLVSLTSLFLFAILAYHFLPSAEQSPRFSFNTLASVWRFSAGMAVVAGLSIMMANLDKLILSAVLDLAEFGRYALAALGASTLYLFVVPITQGFYPSMIGMHACGNRARLIRLHHASSQLVTAVTGSIAIVLMLFSMPVLYVWSGDMALARETSHILSILAAAALANCLGHIGHNIQMVAGAPLSLAITGVCAVLLTLFALPTAVAFGVTEATYAWLGISVLQASIILFFAHRGYMRGEGFRWLACDTTIPLVGALTIAWFFSLYVPHPETGRLLQASFLCITTLASFMAAVWLSPALRNRAKLIFNRDDTP
jgi:O-antigen/teichoic acid export membrane protein